MLQRLSSEAEHNVAFGFNRAGLALCLPLPVYSKLRRRAAASHEVKRWAISPRSASEASTSSEVVPWDIAPRETDG